MVANRVSSHSIWKADADVLHHALVFMVKDVAMQNIFADISLIAGANDDGVKSFWWRIRRYQALNPKGIFPNAFQTRILRVHLAASIIDRAGRTDILAIGVEDFDDLERIHMDVEWMADKIRLQRPFIDTA